MAVTLSCPPEVSELQEGIDFRTVSPVPLLQLGVLCYSATLLLSGPQGFVPFSFSNPGPRFHRWRPPAASDKFKARAVPHHRCPRAVTILWAACLLAPLPQ